MGNQYNRAIVIHEIILKPPYGFSIQMVGRFIKQQQIRLRQKQLTQRNSTRFTT